MDAKNLRITIFLDLQAFDTVASTLLVNKLSQYPLGIGLSLTWKEGNNFVQSLVMKIDNK